MNTSNLRPNKQFEAFKSKLSSFLSLGISPQKLSLAIALGVCFGIIPLLGTTTLICTGIALALRLNMPLMQAVNYVVYPLQLLLFIPFLKVGSWFSGQSFDYSLQEIQQMLADDMLQTIEYFFQANMYALLIWLALAPLLFVTFYFISFFVLKRIGNNRP